jgi:hypothetical protein
MLELIILALITGGIVKAVTSEDKTSSNEKSSEHKSYENIRVYPNERRAVRYHNGETDEYEY